MRRILHMSSLVIMLMIWMNLVRSQGYKEILASSNACYPATSYTATIFNAPESGEIVGIKAVHKSGSVSSHTANGYGYWGSSNFGVQFLKVINAGSWLGISYYPTAETQGFTPGASLSCSRGCNVNHYQLSPYTTNSAEIMFIGPTYPVTQGEQFMFQMTEGCCSFTTEDNGGTGCAEIYFLYNSCVDQGEIKSINWNELQNDANNLGEIPYSDFNISLDKSRLEVTFDIDLEYIGNSSDTNSNQYNLGTSYVIDFQSFGTNGDFIDKPGNCQNRLASSFVGNTDFDSFWIFSEYPYLPDQLGTDLFLAYPPPSQYWSLSIEDNACSPINYQGIFSWNDLSQCIDYDGNSLITVQDDENAGTITLSGTFYVNVVSPFSMGSDSGIYRSFPLIQQDFSIELNKVINVLSSTGVELFISSIIGVYEDEIDKSFELSILTQSADYIELINPNILSTPLGNIGIINSITTSCIVASSFTCGQIFTITIDQSQISCPPADLSGDYDISFTVNCRNAETVCNTFIDDNNGSSIALTVTSNFVDNYCEAALYQVIFTGNMEFYDDAVFTEIHNAQNGDNNYVIGQDTIYIQVEVTFPDDGSGDNLNIFEVEIDNVLICTADDGIDLFTNLNQQNGQNGGCLSSNIDADGPYNVILNGIPDTTYNAAIITSNSESNIVRCSFLTFDIGRTTMYVHVQLTLLLQNGSRRRLQILQNGLTINNEGSTQIRHFLGSTTIVSGTNILSTETNEGDTIDKALTIKCALTFTICFLCILFV